MGYIFPTRYVFRLSIHVPTTNIIIAGLHIAQVHAIFDLLLQFCQLPHLLAYIKWFMTLGQLNLVTGMYSIQHSKCHYHPNAEIVVVDQIVCSAHLMGKSGQELNCNWMMSNVMEKAEVFWVNSYIDMFIATLSSRLI